MLECNEIRGEKKVQNTQILKSKLFFIKAKIRKLYTFSLTEALGKLLNGHASPITMLGKSAKDLAESIWNTVCQRVREKLQNRSTGEITGHNL